jgi:hypothetical protein
VLSATRGTPPRITVRFAAADRTFAVAPPPLDAAPAGSAPPRMPPRNFRKLPGSQTRPATSGAARSIYSTLELAIAKFNTEMNAPPAPQDAPEGAQASEPAAPLAATSDMFAGTRYAELERTGKQQAHERFVRTLGRGEGDTAGKGPCVQGRALLQSGSEPDISVLRSELLAAASTVKFMYPTEKAAFTDALRERDALVAYAGALFDLLESADASGTTGGGEAAFTRYADALAALPATRSRLCTWPVATSIPGVARPDLFPILKPGVTRDAASAWLGGLSRDRRVSLAYRAHPNWETYRQFIGLCTDLLARLRPLGAKDFIDIQSFIWVVEHYHRAER